MAKLILFDIDGTLLDSGGAGIAALDLAFAELFGIPDAFAGAPMAGRTDLQIIRSALSRHGLPAEDPLVLRLCSAYRRHLELLVYNNRRSLKPRVRETLSELGARPDVQLALLTGNIEAGARLKLEVFGLNAHFPFGAFGDDEEDRNRLLPVAVGRYARLSGRGLAYEDCIVIGDTPRDVECAKIHGACAVAVATGPYSREELSAGGADYVVGDMSEMDCEALLRCGRL